MLEIYDAFLYIIVVINDYYLYAILIFQLSNIEIMLPIIIIV